MRVDRRERAAASEAWIIDRAAGAGIVLRWIEYRRCRNKFGIDARRERFPQALLAWKFLLCLRAD